MASLIHRSLTGIITHPVNHFITIIVVSLNIFIASFFYLIYINLNSLSSYLQSSFKIIAFVKKDADPDAIPQIYKKLSQLNSVQSVAYISPEKALNRLKLIIKDDKEILKEINPDFIPPSFEIKLKKWALNTDNSQQLARKINDIEGISDVRYGKSWIESLSKIIITFRTIGIIGGIILFLSASFLISLTIRINISSKIKEIEIMKLLGATNSYIIGPFIMQAAIQSVTGSSIAILILYGVYWSLINNNVFSKINFLNLNLFLKVFDNISIIFLAPKDMLIIFMISAMISILTAYIAINRHLRGYLD